MTKTTHSPFLPERSLDTTQFALIVSVCVTACQEALKALGREAPILREDIHGALPTFARTHSLAPEHRTSSQHPSGNEPRNPERLSDPDVVQAHGATLLLTVEEAAHQLCIGRPKMWQLVMRGEVVSLKIGASRRVPVAALDEYVQRLCASAERSAKSLTQTPYRQATTARKGGHDDDTRMA